MPLIFAKRRSSLQTRTAPCYPPLVVSAVRRVSPKDGKEDLFTTENTEGSENFKDRRILRISVGSSEHRERVAGIFPRGTEPRATCCLPAFVCCVEAVTRPLVS